MKHCFAFYLVVALFTLTLAACGPTMPSIGTTSHSDPRDNPLHHPASWSTQLAAVLQVAAKIDPSAVLTEVTADPEVSLPPGDFRTLDVEYDFISEHGSFWISIHDTNVPRSIQASQKIMPTDRKIGHVERERLGNALTRVHISPHEVIERTRSEVQQQLPQHAPRTIDLRLRLLETPPQWSIRYYADVGESTREFAFRVDATSGAILARTTYP